jgi:hypothetical protein
MHWLYFSSDSPGRLERAGFQYDSTWGYNDAVGFRAGTSQVFRLPGTRRLMELPLTIMDSALFYSHRMGLSSEEGGALCREILANARRFGGALVINWHDRSLAPERLWTRAYRRLLTELDEGDRVWFATAAEAVEWYRWRRAIRFSVQRATNTVTVTAPPAREGLPAALIRIHHARRKGRTVEDFRFDGAAPARLAS